MNEFELIAKLIPGLATNKSVVLGAGHDCAALDLGLKDELVLFKTDAVVEGIHFTKETPPKKVGRKALARCLSDLAAMGGTPTACLITIGLPKEFDPEAVLEIFNGINELAREHEMAVAGGETTTNPERIFISVAAVGKMSRLNQVNRAGAKEGDGIFVTGELGGSIDGKHLEFEPRLREGRWLVSHFPLTSMMDLSDGLAGDLRHILEASGVGAELLSSAIPISRAAKLKAKSESSSKPPLLAALTDGEDFELLFTLARGNSVRLVDEWKKAFPEVKLSCIGRITKEPGLKLRDKDGSRVLGLHGYTHFKKS
jgi:thiamine-monophosphate kinase